MADRPYLLERIDDAAVVQLYADGFDELRRQDRVLVWHLAEAVLWGRDIYYDQRYRHGLVMRELLEQILRHPRGWTRPPSRRLPGTPSCSG